MAQAHVPAHRAPSASGAVMRWTITNTDDGAVTYGEADNPEDVLTAMHDGVMLRDSGQPGKSGTFQEWKFGRNGEVVRIGPIYRVQRRRSAPTGRAMATYRVRLPVSVATGIEEVCEATVNLTMSEFLRVAAVERLRVLGYD